jgi:hypothetical protein
MAGIKNQCEYNPVTNPRAAAPTTCPRQGSDALPVLGTRLKQLLEKGTGFSLVLRQTWFPVVRLQAQMIFFGILGKSKRCIRFAPLLYILYTIYGRFPTRVDVEIHNCRDSHRQPGRIHLYLFVIYCGFPGPLTFPGSCTAV